MENSKKTAHFYYQDPNAPQPNLPLQIGVSAFIERDGALLLERRSDCNRWSLIGGAVTVAFSVEVEDHQGLRRSEESRELAYIPLNVLGNVDIVETHRHIVDSFLKKTPPIVE